ncbi:sensor histidine kinase [Mucilaginibacter psychrotolerans]|uniref:histidine kinase n=1 Tax=Mucilaginibacter psychrotolerans TaxID=1524096 RepID=A0A4Y8SCS0_9SPHI|nr:HAMP domain-containing sensor histidine kinase [Mucilaginibacter psychrotolerans]TFF36390.1 HAMP domain-containing histidine kinase [Mucilaginibacter psychrotolerans]
MKLASHYNRVSILVTLSVLFVGAIIYFFAINNIAARLLDDHLSEEVSELLGYINARQELPNPVDFDDDQTKFIKTSQQQIPTRFYDTVYHSPKKIGDISGRAVEGKLSFKGQSYKFIIIISSESAEYLVQIIGIITLLLMCGLFGVLFLANKYFLNGLWRPFYKMVANLKSFDLASPEKFTPADTQVTEFIELDAAVLSMANRVKSDYQNLKQFTENASHEMMTPLSVIKSKLDTLIQDDSLEQEQFDQINDIYSAAGKLSRLNQSLLLLVKIENNLITETEELDMGQLIADKIRQFQELSASKAIVINSKPAGKLVKVSKYLIDILLNNLFSNAIRHNVSGGTINIYLTEGQLTFQNTGATLALDGDKIFDRFQKGNNSEGAGLGLTIVKNICNTYNWALRYEFTGDLHAFSVQF